MNLYRWFLVAFLISDFGHGFIFSSWPRSLHWGCCETRGKVRWMVQYHRGNSLYCTNLHHTGSFIFLISPIRHHHPSQKKPSVLSHTHHLISPQKVWAWLRHLPCNSTDPIGWGGGKGTCLKRGEKMHTRGKKQLGKKKEKQPKHVDGI